MQASSAIENMGRTLSLAPPTPPIAFVSGFPASKSGDERERILTVLERCGGNQAKAAADLGMAGGTLIAQIEKYGPPRPKKAKLRVRRLHGGQKPISEAPSNSFGVNDVQSFCWLHACPIRQYARQKRSDVEPTHRYPGMQCAASLQAWPAPMVPLGLPTQKVVPVSDAEQV